jgi:hypothetical protein
MRCLGIRASVGLALLMITLPSAAGAAEGQVPGWLKGGTDAAGYVIGTESADQGKVAYIRADDPRPDRYGMLYQAFAAEPYRGRRHRLTARIRTEDVEVLAAMWMRVDHEQEIVAFDNMGDRPITGTTDWQEYSIVLDVPESADTILFGLALSGGGKAIWDDVRFEEVSEDVPTTGILVPVRKSGPSNLDFDR